MSDAPQGDGWWQASDGKWYAPEQAQQGQQVVYVQSASNGMAVAALVLGVVGVLFGLIPILAIFAMICAVLALVFGFAGRRKATRIQGEPRKGMATAGIVLGGLGVALSIIGIVVVSNAFDDLDEDLDEIDQQIEEDQRELDAELEELDRQLEEDLEDLGP